MGNKLILINLSNNWIEFETGVFKQFKETILPHLALSLQIVHFPLSSRSDICKHVVNGLVVFFSSLDLSFEVVYEDEKLVEVFALQDLAEVRFAPKFPF